MALTTIPSELSSVSGISDSSTSTAITIDSSQNVTFAGNITTGSNTISGVLSSVTGSLGSAATATTQAASDNSTKLATTAYVTTALANMVDSAPSTLNTLNELAAALGDDANFSTTVTNSIATKLPLAGGTLTGDINFGDNDKAIFGAGSDLQIYHTGTYSLIADTSGTGPLRVVTNAFQLNNAADTQNMIIAAEGGAVNLYHAGNAKLATTSTGIDVTGAIDVSGVAQIGGSTDLLYLSGKTGTHAYVSLGANNTAADFFIGADTAIPLIFRTSATERMRIDASGNLLIGKTAENTTTVGIQARADGLFAAVKASAESAIFGRNTDDGNIVLFRKDGSAVGSIGTSGGDIYLSNGTKSVLLAGSLVLPRGGTGGISDGTVDLGNSSNRFRHLYLSGDVVLGSADGYVFGNTNGVNIRASSGKSTIFQTAGSERMRIDPNGKIFMTEGVPFSWADSSQNVAAEIYGDSSDNLIFRNTSAKIERMRIDSSGNVLIGRSSDPYSDGNNVRLHVEGPLPAAGGRGQMAIATTAAYNATDRKAMLNFSGAYDTGAIPTFLAGIAGEKENTTNSNYDGALTFHTRPNGGGLSERMRIDSSGNVGIGTNSPLQKVHSSNGFFTDSFITSFGSVPYSAARPGVALDYFSGGARLISWGTASARGTFDFIHLENDGQNQQTALSIDSTGGVEVTTSGVQMKAPLIQATNGNVSSYTGTTPSMHSPASATLAFSMGGAERMRINSSGRVGIGTDNPACGLDISNGGNGSVSEQVRITSTDADSKLAFVNTGGNGAITQSSGDMRFMTNTANTERMRINSSGNLLVGCTDVPSASVAGFAVRDLSFGWIHTSYDSTNTRSHHIFYNPNGSVGTIQTSGSSTLYNTSSDQRLKENIVDAPSASDDIDALQVRSFDWKVDGSHQKYGMVAQELQNVAPEAVSAPEDPEEMMGVDYSKLVPMLVKEIQALRARVQQLENN